MPSLSRGGCPAPALSLPPLGFSTLTFRRFALREERGTLSPFRPVSPPTAQLGSAPKKHSSILRFPPLLII